ncbi:XRE family transcriptional regulator [Sinomicrobium soli]|uniref:XRE family transcriptional regulator n=1 Tax=Sinomicrobium sp. N-1-3-6 TaxID=2219864 RepID=UPI000DCBBDDA|nr:XRE family transcriptional regulator [Sinomicrobium sp. N-1-3-6]RAV30420.1 XRE family transcriptional regulator [Sinomicrobium sp. N-1-3-6]
MRRYSEAELDLLNVQIGCVLKLARLKEDLSQFVLAERLDSNPTMIGRVERYEHASPWDKIYLISQELNIEFCDLFVLKSKEELLSIVKDSFNLEKKLTKEKERYYKSLEQVIIRKYEALE